jgi:dsDNA-specific endonuclease/ATPase MutS2
MSLNRYKLPIIPEPRVVSGRDFDQPTVVEYDEVIYDYNTRRYITLSQQQEIYKLKDELKKQSEEKKRKLKNIIGYYYKRT